jgi:glycosyltransferase involved in cell wall biosynthesis
MQAHLINNAASTCVSSLKTQGLEPIDSVSPQVAILLCTFHGEKYLSEQLESIAAQTHKNWKIWVSDDGSQDQTHKILIEYQELWGKDRLSIHSGPREGFVTNFLSLVSRADSNSDFYAYSDQDDIWESDKLERAVSFLTTVPNQVLGLYCSRTRVVNQDDRTINLSPDYSKPPSFRNALTQNIASGNTMVFNKATRAQLIRIEDGSDIVYHDWFTYILVTGCGGEVYFDKNPSVRYRQHDSNQLGSNLGFLPTLYRFSLMLRGRFRGWNEKNISALKKYEDRLTKKSWESLRQFDAARHASLPNRMRLLIESGVYRQTLLGNIGLFIAALLKKI